MLYGALIGAGVGLIVAIVMSIVTVINRNNLQKQTKDKLKANKDGFIFIEGEKYELIFVHPGKQADVTLNSKTTWDIRNNGKSKLIDMTKKLSSKNKKVIIVFTNDRIKRFINESEMEFLQCDKKVYDMYIVRDNELDNFIGGVLQ